jgi:Flp pilus assembly protein TadD
MTRSDWKFRAAAPRVLACAAGLILLCGCEEPQQANNPKGPQLNKAPRETEVRPDVPPTAKTLYSMAEILAAQGKDKECEFVLRRCIQEYPRFTPAHNNLAELQMRQGRVHEAVATLSKALEVRPKDPVLLNNLGMCLLLRKKYAQALDRFTQASGLVPESEKYRANMATALGLLGREEEAQALFEQTLTIEKAKHNVEILREARERQANPPQDAQAEQ